MLTLNTILEEIKDVPVDKLEELHLFIKSLIYKEESELTDWQIELIKEGEKEIEEGRVISHEDFLKSYGK
jgi:predicted transcriptional regulator